MSKPTDIIDIDYEALTEREVDWCRRINRGCILLAVHKTQHDAELAFAKEFDTSEQSARVWIAKAIEYMACGAFEGASESRQIYHERLSQIYALCMARAVSNDVEVTTKPIRVGSGKESKIETVTISKTRPNALNHHAVSLALKAAREAAVVTGGRPVGQRLNIGTANFNQNNNNTVVGGASGGDVASMSDEQLMLMLGGSIAQGVPEQPESEAAAEQGEGGDEEDQVDDA